VFRIGRVVEAAQVDFEREEAAERFAIGKGEEAGVGAVQEAVRIHPESEVVDAGLFGVQEALECGDLATDPARIVVQGVV
jgi:hypothetical protein